MRCLHYFDTEKQAKDMGKILARAFSAAKSFDVELVNNTYGLYFNLKKFNKYHNLPSNPLNDTYHLTVHPNLDIMAGFIRGWINRDRSAKKVEKKNARQILQNVL